MSRLIFPLVLAVATTGAVWAATRHANDAPRRESEAGARVRNTEPMPISSGGPAPVREISVPRSMVEEAPPDPSPRPLGLESPGSPVRVDLDAWADQHKLDAEQRTAVISAIRDARDNRDIEQRAANIESIPRRDRNPEEQRAQWLRVRTGVTVAPQLYADVERIAGKQAALDFEAEFGDVLVLLFLDDAKGQRGVPSSSRH